MSNTDQTEAPLILGVDSPGTPGAVPPPGSPKDTDGTDGSEDADGDGTDGADGDGTDGADGDGTDGAE